MKRFQTILLTACILSVFCACHHSALLNDAKTGLMVPDVKIKRGETAELVLSLSSTVNTYNGFQLDLQLPQGVTVATGERGELLYELAGKQKGSRPSVIIRPQGEDLYRILAYTMGGELTVGPTGAFLSLSLQTTGNVSKGKYPVTVSQIIFSTSRNHSEKMDDVTATVKVK